MHISDGILPTTACVIAQGAALAGVWWTGRKVEPDEVIRMGLLSSAVFAVSMVHFPVGGTSVHLSLLGLAGILLGRRAVSVLYVTLLFQALLFQHGGLLALGVNVLNLSAGALAAAAIWRVSTIPESLRSLAAGFIGAMLPALLMGVEFFYAGYGKGFGVVVTIYTLVALIEGAVTSFVVAYLRRVKPAVLSRAAA